MSSSRRPGIDPTRGSKQPIPQRGSTNTNSGRRSHASTMSLGIETRCVPAVGWTPTRVHHSRTDDLWGFRSSHLRSAPPATPRHQQRGRVGAEAEPMLPTNPVNAKASAVARLPSFPSLRSVAWAVSAHPPPNLDLTPTDSSPAPLRLRCLIHSP